MADQFLSLLDITARRNTDQAVGLVEEVVTYAPEIEKVMGRPIPGNFYNARVRTLLPGGAAFRAMNQGVAISASRYVQKRFDCFTFDAELQVDEAEGLVAEQQGDSLASLQADEASGALRQKAIALGTQFYAGTSSDAAGHPGLKDFVNTAQLVDAGGSAAGKCEVAWFIWMHPQGVHWLFGGNQGLDIKPWMRQQVKDSSSKSFMAWVTNIVGQIGLSCAHVRAVGAVKNIDNTLSGGAYTKPITDALIAQLMAKFPVGIAPNLCFMSRASRAGLQASRTVTLFANLGMAMKGNSGAAGLVAPLPTATTDGVPIVPSDSITAANVDPF
jgi:hypothetical protein